MEVHTPLDLLPLWGLFLATMALVVGAIEIGYRVGRFRRRRATQEKEAPVGAMVGATFGLLAFFLAFTFGMAATRYDNRRALVVEEANAIGTCYLRAEMMSPPERAEIRKLLRLYTDERLSAAQTGNTHDLLQRSETIQGQLWELATALAEKDSHSIIVGLFVQSLNDLIDTHSRRVQVALRSRIPASIWGALYLVAILSMVALGYHSGLSETIRSPAVLVLAVTFSAVIILIADLDRPREGMLRVSQQALVDLRTGMKEP